jgi:hypothetical protein|nr:MAG TPA_asm: protein of unknown function (DUF4535) [Caudoviricetes sp.]
MINTLISALSSLIGTLGGILAAQSLVNWRLQSLEKKIGSLEDKIDSYHELDKRITILEDHLNAHL